MKIIKHKEDLPTPCKTCRKLRQTIRIPVYHCGLKLHFPTVKKTCKREKMKAVPLFKKFLRDNGIFEQYYNNSVLEYGSKTHKIVGKYTFISSAFCFSKTVEGFDFWDCYMWKWKEVLERNK